jgi:hypothetical protein
VEKCLVLACDRLMMQQMEICIRFGLRFASFAWPPFTSRRRAPITF